MAKTKRPSAPSSTSGPAADALAEKPVDPAQLRGEMAQLSAVRVKFSPLAPTLSRALLSRHGPDDCRERGSFTRAKAIFRDGMRWTRTIHENPTDPALSAPKVRWFLDCLTALGEQLSGRAVEVNPATHSAWSDARHDAQTLFDGLIDDLREAAGSRASWLAVIEQVRGAVGEGEPVRAQIEALLKAMKKWSSAEDQALLEVFNVTPARAQALRDVAATLDQRTRERGAEKPLLGANDSPAVNITEGRLLFAMRDLWIDAAKARDRAASTLVWSVSPSLLRGLGLRPPKHPKKPTE